MGDQRAAAGRRVAVIVPCLDEEAALGRCLASLRRQVPAPSAIIVVDSGSRDASASIAAASGAAVVTRMAGTIAAARNAGAAVAVDADVLAFLDADCEAAPGWLATALAALETADLVGGRVEAPAGAPWPARRWGAIEGRMARPGAPVWSANMVVRRSTFATLGGFCEGLPTGEDVDLCRRLASAGGLVAAVPGMRVVHHGFPATLRGFVRRERWHASTPGWWYAASPRARALVLVWLLWAGTGGGLAVRAALRSGRRRARGPGGRRGLPPGRRLTAGAGWVAGTAVAVLAGGVASGSGREAPRDGLLLAVWALARATRLGTGLRRRVQGGEPPHAVPAAAAEP